MSQSCRGHAAALALSLTAAVGVALLAGGCAVNQPSPPAPAGAAPAQAAAQTPRPPQSPAIICGPQARYVTFASLGAPASERAVDLASAGDHDYLLFAPARLVRISREGERVKAETVLGDAAVPWTAMALDPLDGSAWIATAEFALVHVSPALQATRVPIQHVAGTGGFVRLVAAPDALYAMPQCADDAVWRLDRTGKVLGSAFPAPRPDADPAAAPALDELCSRVRLDRDTDGRVVAWDWRRQELFRADERGAWSKVDPGIFASLPNPRSLRGVAVGSSAEQWYFSGAAGLFLWKGRPVFLGMPTIRNTGRGTDTVLLVPGPDGARELVEDCHGAAILRVAATPDRYAALTRNGIVLGDFATAPDLP